MLGAGVEWTGLATGWGQAGVPALSSAEAELKVGIAVEVEMAYAVQLLMQLGNIVKKRVLWTNTSACKSLLTRDGLWRVKHLDAP